MRFFENSNPVPATYAKQVAIAAHMMAGGDKAELLAVWARIARDEDAREFVADVTNGELEIMVED